VACGQYQLALPLKENPAAVFTVTYSKLRFLDLHHWPTECYTQPPRVIKSDKNKSERLCTEAVAA
jgi:hypothetical protein